MRLSKHSIRVLAALLPLVLLGCFGEVSTSPKSYPPRTHKGANVVACYINGRLWVSDQVHSELAQSTSSWYAYGQTITGNVNWPHIVDIITLIVYPCHGASTYIVDSSYNRELQINAHYDIPLEKRFEGYEGTIDVSDFDTSNQVIAGTFNFTGTFGSDTVHVTDGMFDVQYYVTY